uniref:AAA+ ATPase domain-containing protein n=1 Tax=Tetradesmus obliquus TaxID=3088 RepID=A0A383V949_TETOB|eukprot:jgi/Sobl393_1/15908/SZX62098.1
MSEFEIGRRKPQLGEVRGRVAAPVKIKLPGELYDVAVASGNGRLLAQQPGMPKASGGSQAAGHALSSVITAAAAEGGEDALQEQQQQPWQQQPGQQQQRQRMFVHEHHFDPADNGSYPSRQHLHASLWQDMAASHSPGTDPASDMQQPAAAADAADAAQAAPFGWVPDEQQSTAAGAAGAAVQRVRPRTAQIRSRTATSMPLEYFDSPDMEQSDLQQRLFEAQAAGSAGLQALSRFYDPQGAFTWAACVVLQYDRAKEQFLIQWQSNSKTKWVKRLNMILLDEDRGAFRFRLKQAQRRRDEIEREARYSHYVSKLLRHNRSKLDSSFRQRVARMAGAQLAQQQPDVAADFFAAIEDHYKFAVNAAIVNYQFTTPEGQVHLTAAGIQPVQQQPLVPQQGCLPLQLLPPGCVIITRTQPDAAAVAAAGSCDGGCSRGTTRSSWSGAAQTEEARAAAAELAEWQQEGPGPVVEQLQRQQFGIALQQLQRASLLAQPRLLAAFALYQGCCRDVAQLQLVDTQMGELSRPAQLGAFLALQRLHLENIMELLHCGWAIKAANIADALLHPRDPNAPPPELAFQDEDFDGSQAASRVVELPGPAVTPVQALHCVQVMSLLMRQYLRGKVEASLLHYQEFWQAYAIPQGSRVAYAGFPDHLTPDDPDKPLTAALGDANLAWRATHTGLDAWGSDLFCPSPPPLFQLQLLVREGAVQLMPSLDDVRGAVLRVFDGMIEAGQSVEDLGEKAKNPSSDATLRAMELDDPLAEQLRGNICAILVANLAGPAALLSSFAEVQQELNATGGPGGHLVGWLAGEHSLQETAAEIERLLQLAKSVDAKSDDAVWFRLVAVDVAQAKAALVAQALAARQALQNWVQEQWHSSNQAIVARFEEITAALNQEPTTTEEMDALERYLGAVEQELPSIQQQIDDSASTFAVMEGSHHPLLDESADVFWQLRHWPSAVQDELAAARERIWGYRNRYQLQLQEDQRQLQQDLQQLQSDIGEFTKLGGLAAVEERLVGVQDIEAKLEELGKRAELYQAREDIFKLQRTEYPLLADISRAFEPTASMWRMAGLFTRQLPDWMDGPFTEIDAEAVSADVDKWWRSSAKLLKQLTGAPLEVAEAVRQQLQDFQQHVPLIAALRNPGLRDRHWEKISAAVGCPVKADAGFSLSRALQIGLPAHVASIEEVSEYASKEFSLERTLDKMQADWAGVCFDSAPWRATGSSILRGVDDIQQLLDDQVVKTQAMRASPYIGPFEEQVKTWEAKLNQTQDILDEWLKCQQGWLYLEPIFGSDDILQQMPNEGRKFKAVDATWRRLMEKLAKQSEVLIVTADEELLKSLREANRLLEQVQKGLADYLETKRLAFPRFYFLSNDELLEILSETKDPARVQPYLRKIFEGIAALNFGPDLEVNAMISEEGEKVPFAKPFNPAAAGGAVERWLIDCEAAMRDTVRSVLKASFDAYSSTPCGSWMSAWPGQVVLAVDCMYWTAGTAAAIVWGTLQEYASQLTQELMQVVNRVRGELSKLERKTLSALIVIDVHARDVTAELARQGVTSETDFEWISQLRYGWEGGDVVVRMINAAITYGYEYLGNSSRLVITPLTDRCYRTLMGALHLNLGGAPEGPAGTGKTETTKDLAKAIAMQCVVFNCSDGLDYLAMGKFFKGLASSGAWACFDEFNRIDLEVLSVIAQQIMTMQRAKAAGLKIFEFEGTRLALRPTFSVFITMNPGYAGRSELPDNLKALFRSVAMMVPDYALIGEIMLYSSGYLKARDLARKLVATYRLCSEQLSSQSHYDYGMRAVISVLRAAAANKQKDSTTDEEVLMLRCIRDVNAPKFLAPDIPLFDGILSDLFPGVQLPPTDYAHLTSALESAGAAAQLVTTPVFIEKALQLYEMILVRHGLMIVGYSYSAKTSIYKTLATALGELEAQNLMGEHKVHTRVLNPKSITMGQLYGQFDPVSHEWKDGVLAKAFREMAVDTRPDRQWLLFDGPVDAVWIENMNTVLDDNKKLCLNSGEIIQMSASMNLIFEVQDLTVASPATVSRCGMVYVEPSQMGWRPLVKAWLSHRLPSSVTEEQRQRLHQLFEWLVDPCVAFVRKHCKELVATADINLPVILMNLLWSQLDEWRGSDKNKTAVKLDDTSACLDLLFLFSLIWSLGATCDRPSSVKFDAFLRQLVAGKVTAAAERSDFDLGPGLTISYPEQLLSTQLPQEGTVFEYSFDKDTCSWVHWMAGVGAVSIPESLAFTDIVVPTMDTVRYSHIMQLLVTHNKHLLFVGPTGTGKTVYVKSSLDQLGKGLFHIIPTAFSAQTSANQVQDIIDSKLDKRRKGVYGPPLGSAAVVFVDDLNMPALEVYGAQPPVELLRQFLDHGGWYDRADNTFRQLVDMQLVAAMGPPGGGRNPITPRILRHFNVVAMNEFDDATYTRIYSAISDWWVRRARLQDDVAGKLAGVVAATIDIYNSIRSELLPTPAKSHYTYNMRDLSKVFQGMQSIGVPVQDSCSLVRLWAHEALRVFHDRLVDDADRDWFCGMLASKLPQHLGMQFSDVFTADAAAGLPADGAGGEAEQARRAAAAAALRGVLFADFLQPGGAEAAKYQEATDTGKLLKAVEDALADYNVQVKTRLDLVLFRYAAEHICRISRIIKQPYGNALLVGVGGSGRQSLTRLSAFMAEYKLFTIEITKGYNMAKWREDIKKVLVQAGSAGQPTVFLFSDNQMKEESFLEDINNILNTGEVPNLFAKDELVGIMEAVTPRAKRAGKPLTPAGLWAFFLDSVRVNLHLVLTMSPVGGSFRERLRKFPSLVSCTTINWFSVWPADALKSVAKKFLPSMEAAAAGTAADGSTADGDMLRSAVEDACMLFHTSIRPLAEDYRRELGRHTYVTPTSYLELIYTYKGLLGQQRAAVLQLRRRYEVGLEKLLAAEGEVNVMKQELIDLQPKLIGTGKEVEETLRVVDAQTKEAAAKKEVVEGEEAIASEKAAAAKAIKDECEGELAVAMPLLKSALAALNTLTKADITEVRSMKNPPGPVKVTMEAVCQLLNVKPKKVNDPANPTKKIDDYWGPSQALLGDSTFMSQLQEYDKDHIPPACIVAVRPYLDRPEFATETVKKASKAAYGLCCWVRAMEAYDKVAKVVAPKKAALQQAEAEYGTLMEGLAAKKAELGAVVAALNALNDKLAAMQARKQQLEEEVSLCQKKLERATKLIGGLGGEKTRWQEVAKKLAADYTHLTGDVLLSAGCIAYLGPFTAAYRERAINQWVERCRSASIPCSANFRLVGVLGEPVTIRSWLLDGLPNDSLSIDNAIIISKTRRWPLMIDPQGQANKWVKSIEKKHQLEVVKLSGGPDTYMRQLENAVQFGFPVLIEDVGEELDPVLEPLLLKAIFKQGGVNCIRLGDATLEYSSNFRLFMTTKLRNPHYLPEVSVKVALLNFGITREGLEDQLLGTVVAQERPELEEEKARLVLAGAENARQLKEIEDKIIAVLSTSEGNILEDETAINVISSSKALSVEISHKQQVAERTEKKIDEARAGYKPVAQVVSALFFVISELASIEPMYQYSLAWFVALFEDTLAKADKARDLGKRIDNLVAHFQYSLYVQVCRSLFEKDKLLFAFLMTVHLKAHIAKSLDWSQLRFLLTGGIGSSDPPANPCSWLSDKLWGELVRLSNDVPGFDGLEAAFREDTASFKVVYDAADPVSAPLPPPWSSKLDAFQRLLLLRVLRPDKLTTAISEFVKATMGPRFVEPPPLDIDRCFKDSTATTPLIFVLSPGSDPMSMLLKYAEGLKVQVDSISLGQGQGPKASKLIEAAQARGGWVVLQNCHLAVSWMPTLERICEGLSAENTNPGFRLWLSSYPSHEFPVSVLQNGIKMTNDPPKGLRQNLLGSYLTDPISDPSFFGGCQRPGEFKKLLFGLCFFHASVQERLKFGPLGWNVPYQFSAPDFAISARQLLMFLNESPDTMPLVALRYLTGECNYGGRVTDAHDRRTLASLLEIFYNESIFEEGYAFSPAPGCKQYCAPSEGPIDSYISFIRGLPAAAPPEVYGLHPNADITKDQQETNLLLDSLLSSQGGGASGSGGGNAAASRDALLLQLAAELDGRLRAPFDIEAARYKYPVDYHESLNTVLCQELVRFNRLIVTMHSSLVQLQKAIKGQVLMSDDLEKVAAAMYDNRVPASWMAASYPSVKPLGSYMADLEARLEMLDGWLEHGPPAVFWISGFYFTHAFLTGVKQNYARRCRIPIDAITFDYSCLPPGPEPTQPPAEGGAYVSGMFVEGARWDSSTGMLAESEPKVLFSQAPLMLLQPCEASKQRLFPAYECPLYRTPERRGVLATTGHSTNFVMELMIPSDQPQDHWIRRGVAFMLSLAD